MGAMAAAAWHALPGAVGVPTVAAPAASAAPGSAAAAAPVAAAAAATAPLASRSTATLATAARTSRCSRSSSESESICTVTYGMWCCIACSHVHRLKLLTIHCQLVEAMYATSASAPQGYRPSSAPTSSRLLSSGRWDMEQQFGSMGQRPSAMRAGSGNLDESPSRASQGACSNCPIHFRC